ncbi:MAG: Stk1 family PASTA domain-containing Ser/Thr kinase [Acidaminobacteraceae bacterium]
MDKFIGLLLGNRYKIVEKIGDGGMALVYKAKCQLLNRFVAIKILRPEFANEEEFLIKFDKESQAAASLSHPSIVNIFDVGADDDIRYIVMELVNGITLKQYIKEQSTFLPNAEILDISKQIAQAIEHAHANNIVHRDIKPHNILMAGDGRVKVSDFGIARAVTTSTVVNNNEIVGSVHYTSPEQARGGFVDERSDIYSIGILMYELAANRVPFEGDTPISVALKHLKEEVTPPSSVNPRINKGIESIIMKALQKKPESRYQTATQLIEDINKIIENPEVNLPLYITSEDSPTMAMPNINDFDIDEKLDSTMKIRKSGEGTKKMKSKNNKMDGPSIAISVIMALILSLIVVGAIFYKPLVSNFINKEVKVPSVVNEEFTVGAQRLQDLGFVVDIEESVYDDDVEKNFIISQSKEPGSVLKQGYGIKLTVSKGAKMVRIPNVTQKKIAEAQLVIENSGLILGDMVYVESDLPNGYVIEQDPLAGAEIKANSTVDIVVSKGTKVLTVIAPSLLGKTASEAKDILVSVDLGLGTLTYNFSDTYAKDEIMVQGITPGSEVKVDTSVNVVISKGLDPNAPVKTDDGTGTATDGTGTTTGDGTATTTDGNENLSKKSYIIPLSSDADVINVKVVMTQGGVDKTVYEKQHNKSDSKVEFSVFGSGEALLRFYYNGELVHTKDEVFN